MALKPNFKIIYNEKVLFIDRDGTLIIEPPIDFQGGSVRKTGILSKSFQNLAKIAKELGLRIGDGDQSRRFGNRKFSMKISIKPQKMMKTFENEGIFSVKFV